MSENIHSYVTYSHFCEFLLSFLYFYANYGKNSTFFINFQYVLSNWAWNLKNQLKLSKMRNTTGCFKSIKQFGSNLKRNSICCNLFQKKNDKKMCVCVCGEGVRVCVCVIFSKLCILVKLYITILFFVNRFFYFSNASKHSFLEDLVTLKVLLSSEMFKNSMNA